MVYPFPSCNRLETASLDYLIVTCLRDGEWTMGASRVVENILSEFQPNTSANRIEPDSKTSLRPAI